jgi:hypothetical protein
LPPFALPRPLSSSLPFTLLGTIGDLFILKDKDSNFFSEVGY